MKQYVSLTLSFKSYCVFKKQYNDQFDKKTELSRCLRDHHYNLFQIIVRMAAYQIQKFPGKLSVSTNNRELANLCGGVSKATAFRRLSRLIEVGIIKTKINHGPMNNFEIVINPDFLIKYDNKLKTTKSKFLKSDDYERFTLSKKTNCNPFYHSNIKNNIIIPVDKESHSDNFLTFSDEEQNETPQYQHNSVINNEPKSIKTIVDNLNIQIPKQNETSENESVAVNECLHQQSEAQEDRNDNEDFVSFIRETASRAADYAYIREKTIYSKKFYAYLVAQIFKNHIIYHGEREKSIRYIFEQYFNGCSDLNDLQKRYNILIYCVDMAARNIARSKFDMRYIFPFSYLDVTKKGENRTTGAKYMSFINVWRGWFAKEKTIKEQREFEKNSITRRIQNAEKEILKRPSISVINKHINNILSDEKIPLKYRLDFETFINNIYHEQQSIQTREPDPALVSA